MPEVGSITGHGDAGSSGLACMHHSSWQRVDMNFGAWVLEEEGVKEVERKFSQGYCGWPSVMRPRFADLRARRTSFASFISDGYGDHMDGKVTAPSCNLM